MKIKSKRGGSNPIPIEKRFWSKVNKLTEQECWNWLASRDKDGYGQSYYNSKFIASHRLSWILHYGDIPSKLFVCHTCDNPSCVNPKHLFLGTNSDNMLDMVAKKRNPYRKGSKHGMSKLNEHQVKFIKQLLSNGRTVYSIAKEYKVSQGTIRNIKFNLTWTHV